MSYKFGLLWLQCTIYIKIVSHNPHGSNKYKGFSQSRVQLFVDFWNRHPAAWQQNSIPTSDGFEPICKNWKVVRLNWTCSYIFPYFLQIPPVTHGWNQMPKEWMTSQDVGNWAMQWFLYFFYLHCGHLHLLGSRVLTSKIVRLAWEGLLQSLLKNNQYLEYSGMILWQCQVADHEELISLPVASLRDLSSLKMEEVETFMTLQGSTTKRVNWLVKLCWLIVWWSWVG